jgi:hypothetical protein
LKRFGKDEIEILKKLKVGDEITYKNFLSTSSDNIVSSNFIRSNIYKTGKGALIIIDAKQAKGIIKYSDVPKEAEFLFKSGSKFKIEEVLENKVINSLEVLTEGASPIHSTIYKLKEL